MHQKNSINITSYCKIHATNYLSNEVNLLNNFFNNLRKIILSLPPDNRYKDLAVFLNYNRYGYMPACADTTA